MATKAHRQLRQLERLRLGHVRLEALEQLELDHVVAEEVATRVFRSGHRLTALFGAAHGDAQLRAEQITEDLHACGVALAQHREFGIVVLVIMRIGFQVNLRT